MAKFIEANDVGFTSGASVGAFKGSVKNLANQTYHGLTAYWSSTALKYMSSKSPAHFKSLYIDRDVEKKDATPAMVLGSLVHCMVLTPDEFQNEFFIMPDLNFRTNEGKAAREEILARNVGKQSVTDEMVSQAHRMRESVFNNTRAAELLEGLTREAAFFWTCPFTQLNFKAKIDACGATRMIELKTTRDASPAFFQRHSDNMNYDLSIIHYRQALAHVMGCEPPVHIIAVEDKPPYACIVYDVQDDMLNVGHEKWLAAVSKLEAGIKRGEWPNYAPTGESLPLHAPAWKTKGDAEKVFEEDDII
jgi:exodeoxyribonuclease VIII